LSANVKSLVIGTVMLVAGLILWLTGQGVDILIFSLNKIGVVLAILGGLELAATAAARVFPRQKLDR
jgi:hypothetical protein